METDYLNQLFKFYPFPSIILQAHKPEFKIVNASNKFLELLVSNSIALIGKRLVEVILERDSDS